MTKSKAVQFIFSPLCCSCHYTRQPLNTFSEVSWQKGPLGVGSNEHGHGFDLCVPHLPGEEDCCVVVLGMPVTGWVVLPLPAAEVSQSQGCVGRDIRSLPLLINDHDFHHHEADGIADAGVLVQLGCHGEQRQEIVLQPAAVELGHGLVGYQHGLHIAGAGHEPLLSSAPRFCINKGEGEARQVQVSIRREKPLQETTIRNPNPTDTQDFQLRDAPPRPAPAPRTPAASAEQFL